MRRILTWAALCGSLLAVPPAQARRGQAEPSARPQLLVVGTMHFANPGLDAVNTRVEDVLTPDRQAELEALADALAAYRPTHVVVEWHAADQSGLDRAYAAWRAGERGERNERQQIAFRLADKLGLARVHAGDWQGDPPGGDAPYDFAGWARAHDRSAALDAALASLQADSTALEKRMPCLTIGQWLRAVNAADVQARNRAVYYDIAEMGDAAANPGADWVGTWHARNLKIWANLVRLGARPGDRILVLFGSGHRPLIERYARESGRFDVGDPLKWLPDTRRRPAGKTSC